MSWQINAQHCNVIVARLAERPLLKPEDLCLNPDANKPEDLCLNPDANKPGIFIEHFQLSAQSIT